MYVVDRDEQVACWQLISVVENRPQRVEAAAASGSGTVRIAATPCPWKRICLVTKRDIVAHPHRRGILWQGDDSKMIQSHILLNADYGGPRCCLLTTCTTLAIRHVCPTTRSIEQFVASPQHRLNKTFGFQKKLCHCGVQLARRRKRYSNNLCES